MSNGHRRGGFQKKIETVHWTYGSWAMFTLAAGTVAANVLAAQHLPETLMRIRGENTAFLDAVQAPATAVSVAVGLILVPEGTGSTVLWSPITDGDAPWIWWDAYHLAYEEMVTDVIDVQAMSGARRVIDSKAMRRVRNQEVQFVAENATVATASAVNIFGSARFLSGS